MKEAYENTLKAADSLYLAKDYNNAFGYYQFVAGLDPLNKQLKEKLQEAKNMAEKK